MQTIDNIPPPHHIIYHANGSKLHASHDIMLCAIIFVDTFVYGTHRLSPTQALTTLRCYMREAKVFRQVDMINDG